jgi:hypothetical protein
LFRQHLRHDGLGVEAGERGFPGEHLVGHGAQRVDVAAAPRIALAHRLFGRLYAGVPSDMPVWVMREPPACLHRQRDAEISHQGTAILQQNVLRLMSRWTTPWRWA